MCGFVGFTNKINDASIVIGKMMDRIRHRGPDSDGKYVDEQVAMGFRRLSIIDLSDKGSQPIFNEDRSIVITFNGEIYNYQDLRAELLEKGHSFYTHTDTEVLVHSYEEWGTDMLNKLRGMFGFVIFDKNKDQVFGARDFFGIKPVYYAKMGETLMWGSEIKSFLDHPHFKKELNEAALENYLTFQYSPTSETFFKNVYKLPAAHYFIYKDGKMEVKRYWEVKFTPDNKPDLDEWVDKISDTFKNSVEAHKIADVEVGSFLSSGVDSSYVAAVADVDKTFTVGFGEDEKYNEIGYAKEFSKYIHKENNSKVISPEEYWGNFAKIQYHMDEPLADPAAVALFFVCQLASQKVKVVLCGEGADEIYAGYEWDADTPLMQKYKRLPAPLRHLASDVSQQLPYFKGHDFIIKGSGRPEDWFIGQAHVFEEKDAYDILKPKYRVGPTAREVAAPIYDRVKDLSELEKKQYLDLNLWLPGDILLKADKMSMAHSLELRVPYLDREVLREAECYPDSYKLRGDTKAVLRTAANKTLPDAWANRTKKGFPVPIAKWLEDPEFSAKVRKSFTSDVAAEYFDQDKLVAMLNDPKHERRKIWTAYTFLTWHEQFFEKFDA